MRGGVAVNTLRRNLAIAAAVCGIAIMSVGAWLFAYELHAADEIAALRWKIERTEVRP